MVSKNLWLLCMTFFITQAVSAQHISFSEKRSSVHTYVKSKTFEGVVFSKDFMLPFLSEISSDKRFTPSNKDIEQAEKLLAKDLKGVNALKLNQGGDRGPVIHDNLGRFVRQYFGYYTEDGDKIVYISCLLKDNYKSKSEKPANWLLGVVVVLNGGSNYWQVQANLNKTSLFGLDVNNLAAQ